MERQGDELYRVMEEVSQEIEQTSDQEALKNIDTGTSNIQNLQLRASSVTPVIVKRKRGRPRKETYVSKTISSTAQSLVESRQLRKARGKIHTSSIESKSSEDHDDGDTDTDVKSKRSRKTKVLHDDYVADFNTSDEEEGSMIFHGFSGIGRGRGRGRGKRNNCEFPQAFNDFFLSCNEFLGKKPVLGKECVDENLFKNLNDSDDEEQNFLKENHWESSPKHKHEMNDRLEGVVGPGGQTQVQIVNTGDITMIDDQENYIYNIITTTGERESITPIVIPKVADDVLGKGQDDGPLSPSAKTNNDDDGTIDSIFQGESAEPQVTSKETQNKQQKDRPFHQDPGEATAVKEFIQVDGIFRALYRQVASLKQKYHQALQELKKKPQVSTFADLVCGAASFLTDDQLILFTMQLKSACPDMPGFKYSAREKMLALAIYLQNPDLYKWLSLIFHLPSKVILEQWLDRVTRNNPNDAKRLVYNVYTRYIFRS